MKSTISLHFCLLACAIALGAAIVAFSVPVQAQSPASFVPVALAPLQRDTPIELVALTMDADIGETDGHTLVTGNSTFKLHNTDKLIDLQVPVGFPTWAGDQYAFDPAKFGSFSVSIEGKKVTPALSRAELKIGGTVRAVDWYSFTVPLAADEKKTVRFDFQQDLGESILPRFSYGLAPAATWKGSIGSARLTLRFPTPTTPEQLASYEPANATFDGNSLTWRFMDHEPLSNPTVILLRASFWNEIYTKRRAVMQNPKDAIAHATLGSLLRQLALADSSHRDSYFAQAVAELETATRLDPNQRAARQGLATLYELRAGPAAGPRQTAYVLLAAAAWQSLAPTDTNARKQLAEDYFYLGLDAQTRGAYPDALAYFDKARTLLPGGAGPLYTTERAAAQRRALAIAWARALLEQGEFSAASEQARVGLGDSFMSSFYPPAFYAASAQVAMTSGARSMTFRLVPFAARAADLQKTLNDLAGTLRNSGIDATVSAEGADLSFALAIQFSTSTDLTGKLAIVTRALPDRPEWTVLRAVASPKTLDVSGMNALPMGTSRYREEVDLAPACNVLDKQLSTVRDAVKPLENAPATDPQAQLKRALLQNAQNAWQRALTQGRVTYRWEGEQTTVEACAPRAVAFQGGRVPLEWLGGCVGIMGLVLLMLAFLAWQTSRRKIRARGRQAP